LTPRGVRDHQRSVLRVALLRRVLPMRVVVQLMAFLDRFSFRNPKKKYLEHEKASQAPRTAADGGAAAAADGDVDGDGIGPLLTDADLKRGYDIVAGVADKYEDAKQGKLRGSGHMQPQKPRRGRVDVDAPANSLEFRHLKPHQVREDDVSRCAGGCGGASAADPAVACFTCAADVSVSLCDQQARGAGEAEAQR
jgi:hypothetical protein